ncbi:transposase domain-containing protein [Streptomyces achromogenes]|uniref:transposase domain-containing protein n=1 Tax=Streptomyces achromogenes TaxID=67255 RepID=UPI003722F7F0
MRAGYRARRKAPFRRKAREGTRVRGTADAADQGRARTTLTKGSGLAAIDWRVITVAHESVLVPARALRAVPVGALGSGGSRLALGAGCRSRTGILDKVCTPELVHAAVTKHRRGEIRHRLLPARLVVYFVVALCLFARVVRGGGTNSEHDRRFDPC